MKNGPRGFLLIEVLAAIVVLSVAGAALASALGGFLHFYFKEKEITEGLRDLEPLLFDLETGNRPDLLIVGGAGSTPRGYHYEIKSRLRSGLYGSVEAVLSNPQGKLLWQREIFLHQRAEA